MTQVTDEQPISENQQKYRRVSSQTFGSYDEAKMVAQQTFRLFVNEAFAPTDLTTEEIKIRVKRRTKNNKESFDVISYERIGLKKEEPVVVHGPETFEALTEKPVKKKSLKKKA